MLDLHEYLAEVDRRLAEAQDRLARQRQLALQLTADGHSGQAVDPEDIVKAMEETLEAMVRHREAILAETAAQRRWS